MEDVFYSVDEDPFSDNFYDALSNIPISSL